MERVKPSIKVPVSDSREQSDPENGQEQAAREVEEQAREAQERQQEAQDAVAGAEAAEAGMDQGVEDFKDLYIRLLAEFENYRKRADREMGEFKKFANETLIKELLPVVDNLERAIECAEKPQNGECLQDLLTGVELTRKEVLKILERYGVVPITAVGQAFDPAFHQALLAEESAEHPEETVTREMQKGYLMKERLIRPSLVAVSKGK